jgi:hypothetical protein
MSNCPDCSAAMKPLFSGEYCPNECDLPPERRTKKPAAASKSTADHINDVLTKIYGLQGITAKPRAWVIPTAPANPFGGWGSPTFNQHQGSGSAGPSSGYTPGPDDCRDPYCRAKGAIKHQWLGQGVSASWQDHYQCKLCGKEWDVASPATQVTSTI